MAHCPAYQGPICSLCCTLDARCDDLCKPHAQPVGAVVAPRCAGCCRGAPGRYLDTGLGHFLLLMLIVVPLLAAVFGLLYYQELRALGDRWPPRSRPSLRRASSRPTWRCW